MPINYGGKQVEVVSSDKMTPGEIDAIERVTGLTFQKIRRMRETCVCEHGVREHTHKDDAGEVDENDTACTVCSCPEHDADVPTRVTTAFIWVSIRRADMSVKFSDVSDQPLSELYGGEADVPDPTQPSSATDTASQ